MNVRVGERYILAGTYRTGIVTEVHPPVAMWVEVVLGRRVPTTPTAVFIDQLEEIPMRGEAVEPGREAA